MTNTTKTPLAAAVARVKKSVKAVDNAVTSLLGTDAAVASQILAEVGDASLREVLTARYQTAFAAQTANVPAQA